MIDVPTIEQCAPEIAPQTVQRIIQVESGGNPLALNVNKLPKEQQPHPTNVDEAVKLTKFWIKLGYSVDAGLMQLNSQHYKRFGITSENMSSLFEPCNNIRYGARILMEAWESTDKAIDKSDRLLQTLSIYNTGDSSKGFQNGYVSRYSGKKVIKTSVKNPFTAETAVSFDPGAFYEVGDNVPE